MFRKQDMLKCSANKPILLKHILLVTSQLEVIRIDNKN